MTLLAGLDGFARLPFWSPLFLLLALSIAAYSGWSLWRHRERADVYYLLLGLYLIGVQLPTAVPSVAVALGLTCPLGGNLSSRLLVAAPVVVLFVLGSREGEKKRPEEGQVSPISRGAGDESGG